jgi:hypothetical protein
MPDGIAFVLTSSKERWFAPPIRSLIANALSVGLSVRGESSATRRMVAAPAALPGSGLEEVWVVSDNVAHQAAKARFPERRFGSERQAANGGFQ